MTFQQAEPFAAERDGLQRRSPGLVLNLRLAEKLKLTTNVGRKGLMAPR